MPLSRASTRGRYSRIVGVTEETLGTDLEAEKLQRKNEAANHKDFVEGQNRWISRLVNVAGRLTAQLAVMGMPDVRLSEDRNTSPNVRLTLFFERILDALEQLRSSRATYLRLGSFAGAP